jgi:hypothetical protein
VIRTNTSAANDEVIQAEAVTEMDSLWLGMIQEVAKDSISALEGAAKQLISIVSILQGIYFAGISFGNLKQILVVQSAQAWGLVILFILPIALWLGSLVFAINVFLPKRYKTILSSSKMTHQTYNEITSAKLRELRKAHLLLVAGFVPLLVNIVVYLAWL